MKLLLASLTSRKTFAREEQFLRKCWGRKMEAHIAQWPVVLWHGKRVRARARVRGELKLLWCGGMALELASFGVSPQPQSPHKKQ